MKSKKKPQEENCKNFIIKWKKESLPSIPGTKDLIKVNIYSKYSKYALRRHNIMNKKLAKKLI